MKETTTRESGMREFTKLETAASYAMRAVKPMFVFHGPDGGYVLAMGREARELMAGGHEPVSFSEIANAAR